MHLKKDCPTYNESSMIRKMTAQDWSSVKEIYVQGILTKKATFEKPETVTDFEDWSKSKILEACFVIEEDQVILAWASLSPVSSRCVYEGVAEISVYVSNNAKGKGFGTSLLSELVKYAESNNIWTLQANIFPENIASIKLHKKLGFREVGIREKVAQIDGVWKDNVLLEKRSKTIL